MTERRGLHIDDGDRLGFAGAGLRLEGASPDALVLVGTDEAPVAFHPSSPPTAVRTGRRHIPLGTATTRTAEWHGPHDLRLDWSVSRLAHLPGFTLRATVYNGSDRPMRLREIGLCRTDGQDLVCSGAAGRWWLNGVDLATVEPSRNQRERDTWAGFGLPVPFDLPSDEKHDDGHWRSFPEWLTLYADDGQRGATMGAVGTEANVRFDCRVEAGTIRLEIVSEMTDILLAPGEARHSDEVLICVAPYDDAGGTLFRWMAATHGHRTHRGPIIGWCSWYDVGQRITGAHVEAVAEVAAAQRDRLPLDVIQVDDGFERQVGDWACNKKFPAGWPPIVKKIGGAGAMPGIWLAPLAVHDDLGLVEHHPDWLMRDADGALSGSAGNWGPTSHWLDPTHPEVQRFLRETIRAMRGAGFAYYKIDFNEVGGGNPYPRFHDPRVTRLQAFRELYRLYREEMGEDAYLLACSGFSRGVIGYADAARIGPDSSPQWHAPHPCCIRDCLREVGDHAVANGLFFAADPDVTYLKPRGTLTEAEWRTWHSFVGLLGGLAMVSEPLHETAYQTEATLRAFETLHPPAPDCGRSFLAGVDREHRRFGFVAERPWGNFASVLLYNPDETPADLSLDASLLGGLGDVFHVWSFWDGAYRGRSNGDIIARNVPAHGCVLLRLSTQPADTRLPLLIGSDLHVAMGSAEIANVTATPTGITIELTDAGARAGTLHIVSAGPLSPEVVDGLDVADVTQLEDKVWAVRIANRRRGKPQRIRLAVGDPTGRADEGGAGAGTKQGGDRS